VVFVADGGILAGAGFDLDGNPQPSTTLAFACAFTHVEASASGGSRMEGSARTPVAASGTITGGSDILYLEVVIYDAEGLGDLHDGGERGPRHEGQGALRQPVLPGGDRQLWSNRNGRDGIW
jgi:hypothetical protein